MLSMFHYLLKVNVAEHFLSVFHFLKDVYVLWDQTHVLDKIFDFLLSSFRSDSRHVYIKFIHKINNKKKECNKMKY